MSPFNYSVTLFLPLIIGYQHGSAQSLLPPELGPEVSIPTIGLRSAIVKVEDNYRGERKEREKSEALILHRRQSGTPPVQAPEFTHADAERYR